MGHFAVRGVITKEDAENIGKKGARSQTYPRLDIDEFSVLEKHKIKWNLFLQALSSLQLDTTKEDQFGYHQLAGIHGVPKQTWPVEDGPPAQEDWGLYCTHNTNRFLPWHRVYLLLVEQVIVRRAIDLAGKYPENVREEYVTQASQIRLPYWDWAKEKGDALPRAVIDAHVSVMLPDNKPDKIENPLYSYKFHKGEEVKERSEDPTETKRRPRLTSVRSNVFHMLNENRGFNFVAGEDWMKANALETIHNGIHVSIGGDMRVASVAAFDPIFWLHHANIDRIYALWQAMNPDAHYINGKSDAGAPDPGADRHLAPFYFTESGTEWKLNMVQKISSETVNRTTFDHGYHYPDITLDGTKETTEEEVRLKVMRLYGPRPENANARYPTGAIELANITPFPEWAKELPANVAIRHEWIVYYKVEKFIVEKNFTLFFFCGEPGKDPKKWASHEHLVGSMRSFKFTSGQCVNCEEQRAVRLLLSGEIQLTHSLLRHSDETAAVGVEAWLTKALTWRIMNEDGTEHVPTKGLVVGVKSCMTAYPPYSELEGFHDYKLKDVLARTFEWRHHHAITQHLASIGGVVVPVV